MFIDELGQEHVFEDVPYGGVIMDKSPESGIATLDSGMSMIFIPDGSNKTLAELSDEESNSLVKGGDSYKKFSDWIKDNY